MDPVAAGAGPRPPAEAVPGERLDEETARASPVGAARAPRLARSSATSCAARCPSGWADAADAADVHSGVLLRLTAHLWALRASADAEPLESFAGYVAAAAHNACHAFFRNRYPQRSRLRNKLRYVLTRGPASRCGPTTGTSWLAGRAAWSGRGAARRGARCGWPRRAAALGTPAVPRAGAHADRPGGRPLPAGAAGGRRRPRAGRVGRSA